MVALATCMWLTMPPLVARAADLPTKTVERTVTVPPSSSGGLSTLAQAVPCPAGYLAGGASHRLASTALDVRTTRWSPGRSRFVLANTSADPVTARLGVLCVPEAVRAAGGRFRLRQPFERTGELELDPNAPTPLGTGHTRLECGGESFPVFGGFALGPGVRLDSSTPEVDPARDFEFRIWNEGSVVARSLLQTVCFHSGLEQVGGKPGADAQIELMLVSTRGELQGRTPTTITARCLPGYRAISGGYSVSFGDALARVIGPRGYSVTLVNTVYSPGTVNAVCARIRSL